MSPISRRTALSILALSAIGTTSSCERANAAAPAHRPRKMLKLSDNAVIRENSLPGDNGWKVTGGSREPDDVARQIQGYASRTSVNVGESLDFHVSVAGGKAFTVAVYRLGHYGKSGGRRMVSSGRLRGAEQPVPTADDRTGLIECDWPSSWTLDVGENWTSGYFLAVFETEDGYRSGTPFVVRDDRRRADFLVVVPFSTYQAYNFWPADGSTGKSLYKGYAGPGQIGGGAERAFQVSFDRPYSRHGMPSWSNLDIAAVRWLESTGFDVAYASSVDLHEQRVRPERHAALLFPGHDEYWSRAMRDTAEKAVDRGTHLAFFAANNVYWHIRFDAAADGRRNRVVTCYKSASDPDRDGNGATTTWRDLDDQAEQRLLGVQYNGILSSPVPLVINESGHWFWEGTGVTDGDTIAGLVAVEADGRNPKIPVSRAASQTLLSHTAYVDRNGRDHVQSTSLYETAGGTLVFAAATFHWNLALIKSTYADKRVRLATKNLLVRMLRGR
jgi:hypothetical protein